MRTVTQTFNVYTFDELKEDMKRKVLDDFRDINVDNEWYEFVYDDFIASVKEKYGVQLLYDNISFSGFWCQGDGASFIVEFDDKEMAALLDKFDISFRYGLKKTFIDTIYKCEIRRNEFMYYNAGTVSPNIELNVVWLGPHLQKYIEKKADEFYEKLENWKDELCSKLYKMLDDEYTNLTSDELVIETIIDNNYEFYETGEQYV